MSSVVISARREGFSGEKFNKEQSAIAIAKAGLDLAEEYLSRPRATLFEALKSVPDEVVAYFFDEKSDPDVAITTTLLKFTSGAIRRYLIVQSFVQGHIGRFDSPEELLMAYVVAIRNFLEFFLQDKGVIPVEIETDFRSGGSQELPLLDLSFVKQLSITM